jgi:hypothetical protein
VADLAVGDIIKNITDDVKLLVQDQIELAKAELTPAAKKGGTELGCSGLPDTSGSRRRSCSTSLPPLAWLPQVSQPGLPS